MCSLLTLRVSRPTCTFVGRGVGLRAFLLLGERDGFRCDRDLLGDRAFFGADAAAGDRDLLRGDRAFLLGERDFLGAGDFEVVLSFSSFFFAAAGGPAPTFAGRVLNFDAWLEAELLDVLAEPELELPLDDLELVPLLDEPDRLPDAELLLPLEEDFCFFFDLSTLRLLRLVMIKISKPNDNCTIKNI